MEKGKKSAGKNAGTQLVSGPKTNGGKLWSHGPPPGSQVPGPGRPPSELRKRFREILDGGTEILDGYVQGRVPVQMVGKCQKCGHEHESYEFLPTNALLLTAPKDSDRLKAYELAGRFGIEDKVDETFVREVVTEITAALKPEPNGDALLRAIFERLKPVVGARL